MEVGPKSSLRSTGLIALVVFGAAALASCAIGEIRPYELANGLTVVLRPIPRADRVAVVVLFGMGNSHDPVGKSGRAHLLEHLYGTAATDTSSARDVSQLSERYDGRFNMQTGFDYTVIAGVVGTGSVAGELEDAASRMANLRLTTGDLEREIPRVLSELNNMYGGIPALAGVNHVRDRLYAIPGGGRYAGAAEHLGGMSVEELREVWKRYYKPNNAILAIAGGFNEAEVRNDIARYFGAIPAGRPPPTGPTGEAKTGMVTRIGVSPVVPDASRLVAVGYAAPEPGSDLHGPFLIVLSRLWADLRRRLQPGKPPPVFHPPLDDPTIIVMQAELSEGERAESVLDGLDKRLQAALAAKVTKRDRQQTLNSMAMLGTVEVSDEAWRRNVYGLAFSTARMTRSGSCGTKPRTIPSTPGSRPQFHIEANSCNSKLSTICSPPWDSRTRG